MDHGIYIRMSAMELLTDMAYPFHYKHDARKFGLHCETCYEICCLS